MSHMFYIVAINSNELSDRYKLEPLEFAIQKTTGEMISTFHRTNSSAEIAIPLSIKGKTESIKNTSVRIHVRSPSSGLLIQIVGNIRLFEGLSMSQRFYYMVPYYSIKERNLVTVTVYMGAKKNGKLMVNQKIHLDTVHKIANNKFPAQHEFTNTPQITNAKGQIGPLAFSFWNSPCTIKIWHENSKRWVAPKRFTLKKNKTEYIYEISNWVEKNSNTKPEQAITKIKARKGATAFLDMKTGEIILMPPKEAASVVNESKMLSDTALRINELKLEQAQKGKAFAEALKANNNDAIEQIGSRIDCIEGEISALSGFLTKEIKSISKTSNIHEFLPLKRNLVKDSYVYIPDNSYKKGKGKWDVLPAVDFDYSQYKGPQGKKGKIEEFKKKMKESVRKSIDKAGPELRKDLSFIDENLYQWVDDGAKIGKFVRTGDAQILRFSMGIGAGLDYNAVTGMMKASAGGNASLALFEGRSSYDTYLPHAAGWVIGYTKELFRYRFKLGFNLTGFAGASVALEAGVEFKPRGVIGVPGKIKTAHNFANDYVKGKPPLRNKKTESGQSAYARPSRRQSHVIKSREKIDLSKWQEGEGVTVEASFFAGVSAGIQARGAFEIFLVEKDGKDSGWKTLAYIDFSIDVTAGIGAHLSFIVKYENKKLCGHMAVGLCVGVGGKGRLGFSIDIGSIVDFAKWTLNNLDIIGDTLLKEYIVHKTAYKFLENAEKTAIVKGKRLSDFSSIAEIEELSRKEGFTNRPGVMYASYNPVQVAQVSNNIKKGYDTSYFLPEVHAFIIETQRQKKQSPTINSAELKAIDYGVQKHLSQIQSKQQLERIHQLVRLDMSDYRSLITNLPNQIGLFHVSNNRDIALVEQSQNDYDRYIRHGLVCQGIECQSEDDTPFIETV